MKGPGLGAGIGLALMLSLTAALLLVLLPIWLPQVTSERFVILALSLGYSLFLMRRSNQRCGRTLVLSLWLVITLGSWLLDLPAPAFVLIQASSIWIIRSLYYHASPLPALADLAIVIGGLALAGWALLQTGSLVLALWGFFLTQSFFIKIPRLVRAGMGEKPPLDNHQDRFQRAHRVAREALAKLSTQH